jgi:hypothetical protein
MLKRVKDVEPNQDPSQFEGIYFHINTESKGTTEMKPSVSDETLLPDPEPVAAPMNLRAPLNRAHFEAGEEFDFARSKFLRIELIKAGITEIVAGLLLFAGFSSLIALLLSSLG